MTRRKEAAEYKIKGLLQKHAAALFCTLELLVFAQRGDAVVTLQFVDEDALQINGVLAEEEADGALLLVFGGFREIR